MGPYGWVLLTLFSGVSVRMIRSPMSLNGVKTKDSFWSDVNTIFPGLK